MKEVKRLYVIQFDDGTYYRNDGSVRLNWYTATRYLTYAAAYRTAVLKLNRYKLWSKYPKYSFTIRVIKATLLDD